MQWLFSAEFLSHIGAEPTWAVVVYVSAVGRRTAKAGRVMDWRGSWAGQTVGQPPDLRCSVER